MSKIRSLKSIVGQINRDLGAEVARRSLSDDELVRAALERIRRADLLQFYGSVRRQGSVFVLKFTHVAAAQECAMQEHALLEAIEGIAGARIVAGIKCMGGG